jgi:hypothetical protein
MKKILLIALALIGLLSCQMVDKVPYVWQGEKEIAAEGGTVEWTPSKEDVLVEPTIVAVYTLLYDSEEKEAQTTKIDNPGQTVEGEWFKIDAKRNSLAITFSPNDTGYSREVQVSIEDGVPGGRSISVIQRSSL